MSSARRNFDLPNKLDRHHLSVRENSHQTTIQNSNDQSGNYQPQFQYQCKPESQQQRRNSQLRKTSFTTSVLVCHSTSIFHLVLPANSSNQSIDSQQTKQFCDCLEICVRLEATKFRKSDEINLETKKVHVDRR